MVFSIQFIALCLLIARVISVVFIVAVLLRQWRLFKLPIDFSLVPGISSMEKRSVYRVRRILFTLSVIILLGNMIPILIDTITLFYNPDRPTNVKTISVAYAFSNAITAMLSSIMIWALYKLAGLGSNKHDPK